MSVIIHREWVSNNKGRQGAFLSTLSTEGCAYNACCCHEACQAKKWPLLNWIFELKSDRESLVIKCRMLLLRFVEALQAVRVVLLYRSLHKKMRGCKWNSIFLAANSQCKVCRTLNLYFLSYGIKGGRVNAGGNGAMDGRGETGRQNEKPQVFNRGVLLWEYVNSFT